MEDKIKIDLSELDAQSFCLFQKYYCQFYKFIEKKVFEPEFTGQVILDILNGEIKNLKRDETWHY
jgi:hypothetical protein